MAYAWIWAVTCKSAYTNMQAFAGIGSNGLPASQFRIIAQEPLMSSFGGTYRIIAIVAV